MDDRPGVATPIIGQSLPRANARQRVTGEQRYIADFSPPDMLHARLVTVPCARAKINHIDTSRALALPGVHAVLTAADLPQPMPRYGPLVDDRPVLAIGETKYWGDPVAIVAADNEDLAALAATLVQVEYEDQPGVYTLEQALTPQAPLVQDPELRSNDPNRYSNISGCWHYEWGDISEADADLVLENSYSFPMISHFAIEPHAFMADSQGDALTVWSTVQHPFLLQGVLARVFGMPLAKVRVIALDAGGGFGGKGYPKFEPAVAFLARLTGRPVRLRLSFAESFIASRRASSCVRMRTGFKRDGSLVFNEVEGDYLIGAYVDITHRIVSKAGYLGNGPYWCPNTFVSVRSVFSNTATSTAFRGFGAPQLLWALESQMDHAARQLNIDRVDIRLRNLPDRGDTLVPGDIPVDGQWKDGLRRVAKLIGWDEPLPPNSGRGVAVGIKSPAPGTASSAIVRLHWDGSATVMAGTTDVGQGSRTVFAQIVAHELGIPYERVCVVSGDTGMASFDSITASSRSTVFMGNAIINACNNLRAQVAQKVIERFQVTPETVVVANGQVSIAEQALTYSEFIQKYYGLRQGEIVGVGEYSAPFDPIHPLGGKAAFWEVIFFGAMVQVDEETGEYRVLRLATVGDIGKALNRAQVEGQDEGGALMGLGHTMMEHLIYNDDGRLLNQGALDYRIPTAKDIPLIFSADLLENGDGPGPYGAKGTGESGVLAVSSAVVSAVTEATNVVVRDLPLTPEDLWQALQKHKYDAEVLNS